MKTTLACLFLVVVGLTVGCGPDRQATKVVEFNEWSRVVEEQSALIDSLRDFCTVAMNESIYADHNRTNRTILARVGELANHEFYREYYRMRERQHPHHRTLMNAYALLQHHRREGSLNRRHPRTYCIDFARPTPVP